MWKEKNDMRFIQHLREHRAKSFAILPKDEVTDISKIQQNHLQSLRDLQENYFPNLNDFEYKLIRNLFGVDPRLFPHSSKDEFVELF